MSSPRPAPAKSTRKRSPPRRQAAAPIAAKAAELAKEVEQALSDGRADALPPECIQSLMSAACRAYAAHDEAGTKYPPLAERNPATATDVMVTTSGLLKAAGLQVFELGMWVSYTGR
jgi:hypothetical protein